MPDDIFHLGNSFGPNFGIFKVQGVCPMEKYSATLGLQPKKSVEFLRAEFVGDLQHWNFIQGDVCPHGPKIDSGYVSCVPCTPGGCALFLGTNVYSEKSLAPRKFEFLRRLLMQELKQLVAGRVEPHQKKSPWWGHQNFMVRLHPKGSWMLARFFFKERELCASERKQALGSSHLDGP